MSKLKTTKAVAKRFKITRTGKVKKVAGGQDHFNARESGNTTRNKRRDKTARLVLAHLVKETINR